MKIGSLVICPNGYKITRYNSEEFKKFNLPASNDIIYTVRKIEQKPLGIGLAFEEIISPYSMNFGEIMYEISKFVEIQPAMDLTELTKIEQYA